MAKVVIAISKSKKERDDNSFKLKSEMVNDNIKRILSAEIERLESENKILDNANKKLDKDIDVLLEERNEYRKLYYNSQSAIETLNKENETLKSEIEKLKSVTKTTTEIVKEREESKREVSEKDITVLEKLFPAYKFSNELRNMIIHNRCPSEYGYYNYDAECNFLGSNFLGSCDECWNRPCSDFICKP